MYYIYIFIFLLIIYASLYYIFEDELIIYQVEAMHFDFNLLYKKQPIIIQNININIVNDKLNLPFISLNCINLLIK
jgi:hypothetical protein